MPRAPRARAARSSSPSPDSTWARSRCDRSSSSKLSQVVEVVDERLHRAVEADELRVFALDQVVLVGRVGPAAVAEAEVARRQLERLAGEDVARPRAAAARPEGRVESRLLVRRYLRPDHRLGGPSGFAVLS